MNYSTLRAVGFICLLLFLSHSTLLLAKTQEKQVIVAVVDDGFNIEHELFDGLRWINTNEIPNNGIDDDQNGFIDDVYGWDVSDQDNSPEPPDSRIEEFKHGSHMAGLIAQRIKEHYGEREDYPIKLMFVKAISDAAQKMYVKDGYHGIDYAINNGANIINASWNGGNPSSEEILFLADAQKKGVLVVSSVGTYPQKEPSYPAAHPSVLGVAGVDNNGKLFSSNYGEEVDISGLSIDIKSASSNNRLSYNVEQGVSVAVPQVVATVAIMIQQTEISRKAIQYCLKSTSSPLDKANPTYAGQLGAGLLNSHAAVRCASNVNLNSNEVETLIQPEGNLLFETKQKKLDKSWHLLPEGDFNGLTITPFFVGKTKNGKLSVISMASGNKVLWQGALNKLPLKITIPESKVKVTLSGRSGKSSKFGANYKTNNINFSEQYCREKIVIDKPTTFTDGSGGHPYSAESSCKWLIESKANHDISLTFEKLDTEARVDYIYLFRGDNTQQDNYLMKASGQKPPHKIIVERDPVLLWFVSDKENQKQGFEIKVEYIPVTRKTNK